MRNDRCRQLRSLLTSYVDDEVTARLVGLQPLQERLGILLRVHAEGLVVEADDRVVRRDEGPDEALAVLDRGQRAEAADRRGERVEIAALPLAAVDRMLVADEAHRIRPLQRQRELHQPSPMLADAQLDRKPDRVRPLVAQGCNGAALGTQPVALVLDHEADELFANRGILQCRGAVAPRAARQFDDVAEAGRDPHDRGLQDLVGELSTRSETFRTLWGAHDVRTHGSGTKRFRHPVVGELTLAYEELAVTAEPGRS